MSNSTNKVPGNYFAQGLTVNGGIVADSLLVNGVAITSGSGVTLNTDINVGTSTTAAASNITAALKSKNDQQDTTIGTNSTQIAELRSAMDAVYGGTALSWVGLGTLAFASGSQFMPKSGGTFSGDVAYGTNNITSIKDAKFSNALIGGAVSNIYCSNVVASNITGTFKGNGSQLTNLPLADLSAFGTNYRNGDPVALGHNLTDTIIWGRVGFGNQINSDIVFVPAGSGGNWSLRNAKDVFTSNALFTSNLYTGNVIATGSFIGDGSKLTGITATGADATSATNICTVPTSGTTLNIGTNLTSSTVNIGNASSTPAVNIRGGNITVLSSGTGLNGAVKIDGSSTSIQGTTDGAVFIGKQSGTNQVRFYGSKLYASQVPSISASATHVSPQSGFMQTMVVPLSGEQGPISGTSGAGILPTVLFRVPFGVYIYGFRASCIQASTSGGVALDVRVFPQNTVINGTNVNSTTGRQILGDYIYIDQGLYSSVGSTGIPTNGQLLTSPTTVSDDEIIGVFITGTGNNILGLKLTMYYSCV